MPQLTFPITPDGLIVDVRINLPGASMASLRAANLPLPPSVQARASIDTGSNVSGVAQSILQQLPIPLQYTTTTEGIGGSVFVRMFLVSLFVWDVTQPHVPWLAVPDLLVMELPPGFPEDLLIGRDVFPYCKLIVDGPVGYFTLEF